MTLLTSEGPAMGRGQLHCEDFVTTTVFALLKAIKVTLRTEAYFRNIAADALAQFGVCEPPVPVDSLIASLGIPIRAISLPDFFTAATVYEDGLPVMIVNAAKPEPERRRALAHMLGHVLLVLDNGGPYPRDTGPHHEAETIGREIMVPTNMLIDQARLWFNDHRYLSRLFGVEEVEMVERMKELGLIKGQTGAVWDY